MEQAAVILLNIVVSLTAAVVLLWLPFAKARGLRPPFIPVRGLPLEDTRTTRERGLSDYWQDKKRVKKGETHVYPKW